VKKLHLFVLLLSIAGGLKAQEIKAKEENENVYQREFSVGGRLNTDGWSGFLEMGYRKSRKKVTYYQFEFSEKKNGKEYKQPGAIKNPVPDRYGFVYSEKPFIFGKQNNFYQAKLGIGQQYLIGGKGNKNGVLVNAVYYGGLSVGLLKPYYLNIEDPNTGYGVQVKYGQNAVYDQAFMTVSSIIGGAGFGKGWGELSVVPGAHAKFGFRFDWARFNEVVSALEVGINAEYYTKEIPIMIDQDNKKFFLNGYLAVQFGKRWNKKK
jgi:hypothetical protein